jgi:hypothetical protein
LGFEIRTFECPACDRIHQTVVEQIDPMKSPSTNAWLRGQLQARRKDADLPFGSSPVR